MKFPNKSCHNGAFYFVYVVGKHNSTRKTTKNGGTPYEMVENCCSNFNSCFSLSVIPLNSLASADSLFNAVEAYPTPDWAYINRTTTSLSITSAGEATATAQLVGIPGVTNEIWIFMGLERYSGGSWVTINSWYQSFNSYIGTLQQTTSVSSGYWYRVKASYYAYSGSLYEEVIQYSSSVYH